MPLAWYMACQPTHRPVSSSYTLMKKVGFYTLGATVAEAIEENGDTLQQQLDKLEAQGRIPVVVRSPDATQKRWPVSTCGSLSHTDDRVIACAGWQAGRLITMGLVLILKNGTARNITLFTTSGIHRTRQNTGEKLEPATLSNSNTVIFSQSMFVMR